MKIRFAAIVRTAALAVLLAVSIVCTVATKPALAACQTPSVNYGASTVAISIAKAGSYTLWSRIMAPNATSNSYLLEVDGSSCYTIGDNALTPSVWTWVNYRDASAASVITQNLSAGTHSLRLIGREAQVKVDRVIAVADANCKPSNLGDNCLAATDTTPPTITITAPAQNAQVMGNVSVNATAADNTAIGKVEFMVDNTLIFTDTAAPYTYSWSTGTTGNGQHTVIATVYDAAGNSASDSVTVTVKNGDAQAPSAPGGLKAVANAYNKVTLNWTASTDNTGVTSYAVTRNGAILATTTTPAFTDTSTAPATSYSYKVVAYDAANNASAASAAATVTTPGLADTQPPTAPANLSASVVSSSQISLRWAASTDNIGVAGYEIWRATGQNSAVKIASAVGGTQFGDTGLSAATTYSYYVIARDAAGNGSSPSAATSAVTQVSTPDPSQAVGDVRGKVTGHNSVPLKGAKIVITVGGKRYQATTNSSGVYRIYNLPAGRYAMKITASGYTTRIEQVQISRNKTTINNAHLKHL